MGTAKIFNLKSILHFSGWFLSISIITVTVLLYSLHFSGIFIQKHHDLVSKWISGAMDQPVHFSNIELNRSGIDPEIKLTNVEVLDDTGQSTIVNIKELYFRISVIKSLLTWRVEPSLLIVDGANIDVYQKQDLRLNGINLVSKRILSIAEWLFSQGKIFLDEITINWHMGDHKAIAVHDLSLQLRNRFNHHNISGVGVIGDLNSASHFKIIVNLHGDILHWENIMADGYINLQKLNLSQYGQYTNSSDVKINSGRLDLSLWFTWRKKQLQKIQQQFSLGDLSVTFPKIQKELLVNNLSGSSVFTPQPGGGLVTAKLNDADFNYDNWFAAPIGVKQILMNIAYSHADDGWRIDARQFNAKNSDLSVNSVFQLRIPSDNSSSAIKLNTQYQINNIGELSKYYPVGVMSKKLSTWLIDSIKSGQGIDGSLELQGALNDFPFTDNNGKFNVVGNLHDISLYYAHGWPNFSNINGIIDFSGKSMSISATSQLLGLPVSNINVKIADLTRSVLTASGETTGDSSYIFKFINRSPLSDTLGKELSNLQASGPMQFSLNLIMPLGKTPGATLVKGTVQENGGSVFLPAWHLEVKNIFGALDFDNNSLAAKKLTASIFGSPSVISINTLRKKSKHPVWRFTVDGAITANSLQHSFSCFLLRYLAGSLKYHALLNIHKSVDSQPSTVTFISNLRGLAINLPPPLAKSANDLRLFIANIVLAKNNALDVSIKYADKIRASLSYLQTDSEVKFIKGLLHFGANLPKKTVINGLTINGRLAEVVYDKWAALLHAGQGIGANFVQNVNLIVDRLTAFGRSFLNTKILMQKTKGESDLWIKNQKLDGDIIIPDVLRGKYITAKFNKLDLNTSGAIGSVIKPTNILPFHLSVNNLRYHHHYFRNFEIMLNPITDGVNIEKLNIHNDQFKMSATGTWRLVNGVQKSALYGTFNTEHLGDFLKTWNITSNMQGGGGSVTFSLNWNDALYKPSLAELNGNLLMQFKNGQIINLSQQTESEIGFGTVLNIFSLQSLPRRLSLDFSDLTNKGFVFDTIRGDFTLLNGDAYTTDAALTGTVAHVALNGRIGLVAKDYNLYLTVIPYMTSSLPVIVALAGGPVAGAVTWAADELFKHTLQKMTAYHYKVTGAWKSPTVVKMGKEKVANNE